MRCRWLPPAMPTRGSGRCSPRACAAAQNLSLEAVLGTAAAEEFNGFNNREAVAHLDRFEAQAARSGGTS